MPSFSAVSKMRLQECADDLQIVMNEAIKIIDFSVTCGYRNEKEQQKAVELKRSKLNYPNSKHNKKPSLAVDIAPYPIDWKNLGRFKFVAGIVLGIAYAFYEQDIIKHKIRWGGDWNRNYDITDDKWTDLPHFEIVT